MLKEGHHKEWNLPKNGAKWSHLPLPPLLQSFLFIFPASLLPVEDVHFRTVSLVFWCQTGRTNGKKKQWTILSPRIWTLCPSVDRAGAATSAHPTSRWSDSWETSCPMTGIDVSGCKGDLFATAASIRPQQGDDDQSRDPALSHNTIAFCRMPTQVCWHALFYFRCVSRRSFLIYLHNPCDTPINNSGLICISMAEIEDRRTHSKYSPARNKLLLVGLRGQRSPGRGLNVEYS